MYAIVGILYFVPAVVCTSAFIPGQDCTSINLTISPKLQCPNDDPCLTLEEFSKNASQYSHHTNTSLTLELLPGNHSLSSSITIQNILHLEMLSLDTESATVIQCSQFASFSLINITMTQLVHLTFDGCGGTHNDTIRLSTALYVLSGNLTIKKCKFHHSKGQVMRAQYCNIEIYQCVFSNSSLTPGPTSTVVLLSSYTLFWSRNTTASFYLSDISNNEVYRSLFYAYYSTIRLKNSCIKNNIARYDILYAFNGSISLLNTTIINNTARLGQILFINRMSTLDSYDGTVIADNNGKISTIYLRECHVKISGNFTFINNIGTLLISNSKVKFLNITIFQNSTGSNASITVKYLFFGIKRGAGALTSSNSKIWFYDRVEFLDNYSEDVGGALCALHKTKIFVKGSILLAGNHANKSGGGIYLYSSTFLCKAQCIFSNNHVTKGKGGGIYATANSKIELGSECNVSLIVGYNFASDGGGMYLRSNSKLVLPTSKYRLAFEYNHADKGAAMYIDDDSYCTEDNDRCFLQTSPVKCHNLQDISQIQIIAKSDNNTTLRTTIFGGDLHKCFVLSTPSDTSVNKMLGIEYLKCLTNGQNVNISRMITSKAVQVYFCEGSKVLTRAKRMIFNQSVMKGQRFTIKVVAIDQVKNPVEASIYVGLQNPQSSLETMQDNQSISAKCSTLTYNMHSPRDTEEFHISPKRHCSESDNSGVLKIRMRFKECTCPAGFVVNQHNITSCKCYCDPRIIPYQQRYNLFTVVRNNKGWISYSNNSGFIVHPFCPYDFCVSKPVEINLSLPNGSDAQCALNRVGLLCGRCKLGYSLSLSSSRCVRCPEVNWPWALMVVIVKIIAGVVLVIAILILNLTASAGTLNGLVFYANVLAADTSLFLSFAKPNFHTVFIAWLNLDLGFDVCYFKGIDAYSKAWLNISFPTYVITVLLLIILISKYSSRFGELIGKWNPVATLATLLLLSYTKLLRAIITALSFTIITCPVGQQRVVWLQDATVRFFGLKHFPLGLLAIAIITVGFIYTVLLFSWQWILQLPNRQVFKWTRNTRLNLFIEANLAPYKAKYRYWYGLLLLVRMALYLGMATEKSHESVTIVLAIGLIAASILLLRTFLGNNIYRNRLIGYVNSSFYYNLLALSLARLYCQDSTFCRKKSSIISIALAFILFVFIVSYHIFCALVEIRKFRHLIASIEQMLNLRKFKLRLIDDRRFILESEIQEADVVIVPTSTEVTLSPRKDSSDDDERSGKSANKNSPDGEHCSIESEETEMNNSINNENVCKQNTNKKGKQWTNSNTLREPLLQD